MKKLKNRKRALILLSLFIVGAVAAAGGYAYWTSSGAGSGTATVDTVGTLSVTQAALATKLYPGVAAQELTGTIVNGGTSPAQVQKLVATLGAPSGAGTDATKPACTAADFALSNVNGGTWSIAAGGGSATLTVNQQVVNGTPYAWGKLGVTMINRTDSAGPPAVSGNQDNCKSATVNITYAVQ